MAPSPQKSLQRFKMSGTTTTKHDIYEANSIASNIREVPDHQEVYLDSEGFTSIIFEILEWVDKPDKEALIYHLEDVVEGDASETRVITTTDTRFSKLPYV